MRAALRAAWGVYAWTLFTLLVFLALAAALVLPTLRWRRDGSRWLARTFFRIYVALELSSYSMYILVPLRRGDGIDVEAGIKYLFIGAVSSGFMLFGLSYIFGATGPTYLADILPKMTQLVNSPIGIIGILLAMAGFFFKLSVFPFHFWAPDVYQGGANQVVTFIATASKAAAVALLLRLAVLAHGSGYNFTIALVILSAVSMTLGNLVAIVQKDFKRMLAYSSIAHAGVFLMGVLTITEAGYIGAIYYALAYLVMNLRASSRSRLY